MYSMSEREPSSGENSTSSVQFARLHHRRAHLALDVLARGLQLALDVDVAGRDEGVDARALGVAHRVPGRLDVLLAGAREAADHGAFDLARDRLHRLEVARRGDRKARLDHVHAQPRELVGDLQLFLRFSEIPGDCSPSRRVVSKIDATRSALSLGAAWLAHVVSAPFQISLAFPLWLGLRLRGRHALFPPRGEEKKARSENCNDMLRRRLAAPRHDSPSEIRERARPCRRSAAR